MVEEVREGLQAELGSAIPVCLESRALRATAIPMTPFSSLFLNFVPLAHRFPKGELAGEAGRRQVCSGPPRLPQPSRLFVLSSQDAPYLDLAPYMPDYYKPQYLLDFEDRLPSSVQGSDSLSLNSFNSVTSTNLEWDDSAIAPSSEGKRPRWQGATPLLWPSW